MQTQHIEPFLIEAFTMGTPRRDQEFIPLLHGDSQPKSLTEGQPVEEVDARQVFEEAYAQGEKAGYEMGMTKVEPLVARLNSYLAQFELYQNHLLEKAEKLAFELAVMFAESLVLKECAERRETLLRMIRRALELCDQKGAKVIRVRPEDCKYIEGQSAGWTVLPDDTLKEPGFVIETDFGDVDGRISTQLEELKREFLIPTESSHPANQEDGTV